MLWAAAKIYPPSIFIMDMDDLLQSTSAYEEFEIDPSRYEFGVDLPKFELELPDPNLDLFKWTIEDADHEWKTLDKVLATIYDKVLLLYLFKN